MKHSFNNLRIFNESVKITGAKNLRDIEIKIAKRSKDYIETDITIQGFETDN